MAKTPRNLPKWARRLFYQRDTDGFVRIGLDLGWQGPDADIELDDQYRFAALAAATTGRGLYRAGNDYLRKVLANYDRMTFDTIHDPALAACVDAECARVGRELARAAANIKADMRALGYEPTVPAER